MSALPRIVLLPCGGTIDTLADDRLDTAAYLEGPTTRLTDDELLRRVPELADLAEVSIVPQRKLVSTAVTTRDWIALARALEDQLAGADVAGAVVTHGTGTLEETAYFLHLALSTSKPVVLTGALRPASSISPDGDLNLVNAVCVAGAPEAHDQGVFVVLNDTIHCARDVTKGSTSRLQAFRERDLGPLGYVDGDRRVVLYRASARRHTAATGLGVPDELPRVDVVTSYAGADGALVDAAVAVGARGIVIAGLGAGTATPGEQDALRRARERGVAVCVCSRTGSGRVVRRPRLVADGFVAGDDLPAWKARVLLALALTVSYDPDAIQRFFDTC